MNRDPQNPNNVTIVQDQVSYFGYWRGFDPAKYALHPRLYRLACRRRRTIRVVGPFGKYQDICDEVESQQSPFDFFITHEAAPMLPKKLAHRQIGFWLNPVDPDVFRFPNWKLPLIGSSEVAERRLGSALTQQELQISLIDRFGTQWFDRANRAFIIARQLYPMRLAICNFLEKAIPLDRYGTAFSKEFLIEGKNTVGQNYRFSLCPENAIVDGYITEKIPEAYISGCVPITWCEPAALSKDFNPKAVVNLYGLEQADALAVLHQLVTDSDTLCRYLKEPLLTIPVNLIELDEFLDTL